MPPRQPSSKGYPSQRNERKAAWRQPLQRRGGVERVAGEAFCSSGCASTTRWGSQPAHIVDRSSDALARGLPWVSSLFALGDHSPPLRNRRALMPSGTRESTSSRVLAFREIAARGGQLLTTGAGQRLLTTGREDTPTDADHSASTDLSRNGTASHQRCADTRSSGPRNLSVSRARDLPTFGRLATIFSSGRSSRWICL